MDRGQVGLRRDKMKKMALCLMIFLISCAFLIVALSFSSHENTNIAFAEFVLQAHEKSHGIMWPEPKEIEHRVEQLIKESGLVEVLREWNEERCDSHRKRKSIQSGKNNGEKQ
jgi:hypothetical protein